jgi:tetratricopeptide (TPR) repeat protein
MKITAFLSVLVLAVFAAGTAAAQDKPDALKLYRLGRDLEAQGRAEDAAARYASAVQVCLDEINQNAANMDSYAVLTWTLLRQKKYADCIDWCVKAQKFNANDYRVLESLGEAYFYTAAYKESLKAMERYVEAAPGGERASTAYFFMGEIFRIQKRPAHADIAYTTAVKLEPSIALWWYRLGMAREAAGEPAAAVPAYERAIALNPGYKEAAEALARAKRAAA